MINLASGFVTILLFSFFIVLDLDRAQNTICLELHTHTHMLKTKQCLSDRVYLTKLKAHSCTPFGVEFAALHHQL